MSEIPLLVENFPYIGLFLLLILGGVGLPFPEDATLILCGFLWSQKIVNPFYAIPVVYSGLLSADLFLYFMGRKYGRMIITHKKFHKIISPGRLSSLEDRFNNKGMFVILLGRHMFGLRAQIFLVAGVMKMPALKFLLADAVSAIFTMSIMIGAGYAGGNSLQLIKKYISRIEYLGLLVIITLLLVYLVYRYFNASEGKGNN